MVVVKEFMQVIESLKKKLAEDGFVHIFEWQDAPNTVYEEHSHKGAVSMFILEGGLSFSFDTEEVSLAKGDHFDVPIGKDHTAIVGPEGCHYLVGEMIEGDS